MLQAILVSIVAFLAAIDEYTFGASMMGRPLFTAPIVGLILGDFQAGIMIGATLELMFMGSIMVGSATPPEVYASSVLGTAIAGMNVTLVLILGIAATGIIGMLTGSINFFDWFGSLGTGITGMGDLIIITLMAGGMLELIRFNGGVDYIIQKLTKHVNSKRGAELCIATLVSIANFCTANNTIAIITVGPLANDIATRYRVDKRKSASILDTFSCVIQGIIPYGAQMLIASKLAALSPLSVIEYLYYPVTIGIFALLSIILRYPKRYS